MGVILSSLLKQVSHMEMKLVAGEAGLSNEVSWTHMVDSDAVSAFLQGQELAFTTGLGLNENLSLPDLVRSVHRRGASGIVINIGPYISEIPDEVIKFGNENGFPVFEVPWKIHMAEIMRIFCFAITKAEQNQMEMTVAFQNAFSCPSMEDLYVPVLAQKGYLADWKYSIVSIRLHDNAKEPDQTRMEQLGSRLNNELQAHYSRCMCCVWEKQIILLLCNYTKEQKEEQLQKMFRYLTTHLTEKEQAFLCAGKEVGGLNAICKSYEQTEKMQRLLQKGSLPGEKKYGVHRFLLYEDLDVYKVLITMTDKTAMEEYVADTVLPLYEYDRLNQGDCVKMLRCYLDNDCSIKQVSEELVIHRNTLYYKLKKAEEILGMDLSSMEDRFRIMFGMLLYQLLDTEEKR